MEKDPSQNQRNLCRLLMSVQASYGRLNLLIAICDNWKYRDELIGSYEKELAAKGTSCRRVRIDLQQPSLKQCLQDLVSQEPDLILVDKPAIVTVLGVDELLGMRLNESKSAQEQFFFSAQWTREGLREFKFPIVIWLTPKIATSLAQQSPDFWSWRGGVFEFPQPLEMYIEQEELVQISIDKADEYIYPNYYLHIYPKKLDLIDSLQQQINELQAQDPNSPILSSLHNSLININKNMPDENTEKEAELIVENLAKKLNQERDKKFVFLLVGRTGVGKSSTVNSLMGKTVAPVGDYEATTMQVENYEGEISGVKFTIVDTPGLCDDLEEKGNDYQYLELIRKNVARIDLMWFVSRLDDTRVSSDEKKGIKLISEAFSPKIWQQAIIVFTFANNLSYEKYAIALEKRTELIRKEISKYSGEKIAINIPSIAVDNSVEFTPDGERWLGELYTQVYTNMSKEGAGAFFMSTVERIQPPQKKIEVVEKPIIEVVEKPIYVPSYSSYPNSENSIETNLINLNEKQIKAIQIKTAEIFNTSYVGLGLGVAIGSFLGPGGSLIGGAIGAGIGFIAGWFRSKDR